MSLQDLPLEILLEIAKLHPWVGCELAKTVRKVGLYSLNHDVKIWFKVEEDNETFILIKSSEEPYYDRLHHSWNDNPARIDISGQYWYKEEILYRDDDKPAYIDSNGTCWWYKKGKLQRDDDKPAMITSFGTQYWYKEWKLHRNDGKPAIIRPNGTQEWYKEGRRYYPT